MALVGRAKRRRLRGERNRHGRPHLAQQRQHPLRVLLAVGAHGHGAQIGHHAGALGRRVAVAALRHQRPEAHRRHRRQAALGGRFERHLHLGQVKERFQDQKVDARVLEQANLLGDVVARLAERLRPFALDELRARDAAGHERAVAGHFLRQLHGGGVDRLRLRAVAGAAQLLARAEERERLQHLRAGVQETRDAARAARRAARSPPRA